jgi:hypothetical protein
VSAANQLVMVLFLTFFMLVVKVICDYFDPLQLVGHLLGD